MVHTRAKVNNPLQEWWRACPFSYTSLTLPPNQPRPNLPPKWSQQKLHNLKTMPELKEIFKIPGDLLL